MAKHHSADYRVTVVFDYTAVWNSDGDDDVEELDADYLHDAMMDNYDTVDLNLMTEHPLFDDDGDELEGETLTVTLECDHVREIIIEKVDS